MADAIKVLGQSDVSATTITTLYTVPDLTQTTVSSLVVCNRHSSGITFRVSVHVNGAGADDKQFQQEFLLVVVQITRSQL